VRLSILTNLRAGRNDARLLRVLSFLKEHPDIPHVETERHDHVPEALALLAKQEVDVLVVNGGDGTLQHALTEILSNRVFPHPPLIAPLRGGRTNMNAVDVGSPRSPVMALSALIAATRNGSLAERIIERPVLRVDLGPEAGVQYGMSFGAGVVHRTIELKHRMLPENHFQGLLGVGAFTGALIARAAFGSASGLLTPDRVEIRLDGQLVQREQFLLVMATTLKRLFFKLRPFWGRETAPIRFTAIAVGAPRSLRAAVRILGGRSPLNGATDPGYTSHNVQQIELRLDCGLVVDGELFAPQAGRRVRIEADQRVRFVQTDHRRL